MGVRYFRTSDKNSPVTLILIAVQKKCRRGGRLSLKRTTFVLFFFSFLFTVKNPYLEAASLDLNNSSDSSTEVFSREIQLVFLRKLNETLFTPQLRYLQLVRVSTVPHLELTSQMQAVSK